MPRRKPQGSACRFNPRGPGQAGLLVGCHPLQGAQHSGHALATGPCHEVALLSPEHGHWSGSSNTLLPCRAGAFIRAVEGNLLAPGRVRCRAGGVGGWRLEAGHRSTQPPGGWLAGPGAGEEITARDKCHLAHGCVGSREPGMERVGSPGAVRAAGAPPALGGLTGHRTGPEVPGHSVSYCRSITDCFHAI